MTKEKLKEGLEKVKFSPSLRGLIVEDFGSFIEGQNNGHQVDVRADTVAISMPLGEGRVGQLILGKGKEISFEGPQGFNPGEIFRSGFTEDLPDSHLGVRIWSFWGDEGTGYLALDKRTGIIQSCFVARLVKRKS